MNPSPVQRIIPEQSRKMKKTDPRVQCIRCMGCHRLRAHPHKDDPKTHFCGCGSGQFTRSFPHPDEERLAFQLYEREIEQSGAYKKIFTEIVDNWKIGQGQTIPAARIFSK